MQIDLNHSLEPAPRKQPSDFADMGRVLAILGLFAGVGIAAGLLPEEFAGAPRIASHGVKDWHGNVARSELSQ